MKINEVEAAVGVTKKNIRFYEEEGLISPRREPGNGYRSYSEADVERLRRIKLLRKLDVPLAEIRQMLEGECTLAEGMTRQLERLHTRRTDLDEAVNFCTLLQKEPVSLNELDVEQTLARLTAKEEQGVSFVNIEQTDRKAERVRGALWEQGCLRRSCCCPSASRRGRSASIRRMCRRCRCWWCCLASRRAVSLAR